MATATRDLILPGRPVTEEDLVRWVQVAETVRSEPDFLPFVAREDPKLYQEIVAGIRNLSMVVKQEEWRDPRPGIGARPEQLMPGTPGSFSDRTDWLTWLLVGGRGCVAKGTELDTPSGPVPVEHWQGGHLWALHGDNTIRSTWAGPAYRIGRAQHVRLTTDQGDEIEVTPRHRFLTPTGWVRAEDVSVGDEIASVDRSALPSDARRWSGRGPDCQAGCRRQCRSCGPQPRQDSAGDRVSTPRPGDALAHTRDDLPLGGRSLSPTGTHPDPVSCRLSRKHSVPGGPWQAAELSRSGPSASAPIPPGGRTSLRSQQPTSLDLVGAATPISAGAAGLWFPSAEAGYPTGRMPPERSGQNTRPAHRLLPSTSPRDRDRSLVSERHQAASSDCNRWARVVGVGVGPTSDYYDLTVPSVHNYFAHGIVNHNSGKTRTGAEAVIEIVFGRQWGETVFGALVGQTMQDVRRTMIENTLLNLLPETVVQRWNRGACELTLDNGYYGAVIQGYSAEVPRKVRGGNNHFAWGDEIATWGDARRSPAAEDTTWSNLIMSVREHDHGTWDPRIIATTTPKAVELIRNPDEKSILDPGPGLYDNPLTVVSNMSTLANAANLAPHFLSAVVAPLEGTRLYRQEVLGHLMDEALGALWDGDLIDRMTVSVNEPDIQGGIIRSVVAVDPSVGAGLGDECGIVVVGLAGDGRAYVLEDASKRCPAKEWVGRVANMFNKWNCSAVVVEVNHGQELVAETMGRYDVNLPLVEVHAKKGKYLRAEPVALLTDQDRVRLAGEFDGLTRQMRTWDGQGDSPDRLDAFVYGCLYLLPVGGERSLITIRRRQAVR